MLKSTLTLRNQQTAMQPHLPQSRTKNSNDNDNDINQEISME